MTALELIEREKQERTGYLDLGRCGLTELPDLSELYWLETLIVSNRWWDWEQRKWLYSQNTDTPNRLLKSRSNVLPPEIKKLICGGEPWTGSWQISDGRFLEKLTNLSTLDLSSIQINDGQFLEKLTNLSTLYLRSNQITDWRFLKKLTNLHTLDLGSNQISDGSFLEKLTNLCTLNLRSNQIRDGRFLENLTNLSTLDISDNQISDGQFLAKLRALRTLDLRDNLIRDGHFLEKLTNLATLDLSDNLIRDGHFLEKLTNLTTLHLITNRIRDLSYLEKLPNLTTIDLSNNQIHDWRFLEKLTNLGNLDLSSNQIKNWRFLEKLTNLSTLGLKYNQICDGRFLEQFTNLSTLDLSFNQISDGHFLEKLTNLSNLDLSFNQISDGHFLEKLTNLTWINLAQNQLRDFTPLLYFIRDKGLNAVWKPGHETQSREINLKDNPFETPAIEIVGQGNDAILNYFREREINGLEKSLEAKVVLIGEGQAGKTSLRTRLLRPGDPLPTKADRTKGLDIDIEKYRYALASREEMRLNLFDFGGQDHYKPLHQFFYSKNTLYVLVTRNGDAATNDFDFWFDTAQLFGQGSPVLVVNNLFGDVRSQFDPSQYARFAAIIRDDQAVNLGDFQDRRWANVKSAIEYHASRLPHVHEQIPRSWAKVRAALAERLEEQLIPLQEYLRLCALPENGGMDRQRALHCSAYLHDIGIILHYQDIDDLLPWVIVKNEWATEAAYRVIDDPEIEKRNGLFTPVDLRRIWCQPEYEDHRPQLRELMRKFRLCYPLKSGEEFVAPQLLPSRPREGYIWTLDNDLELYVEYEFMPPGLISQLIVECHLLIAEERLLVWREGAVLELPGGQARAEIRLQKRGGKQTIGIRAQGSKRRDLLSIADGKIEELHRYFGKGLRVERKIPCVCKRCAGNDEKWFFNLSELENRRAAGIRTKECELSYQIVSIEELLGNVFSKNVRAQDYEMEASAAGGGPLAFFSYSKKDAKHLADFQKYLRPLERSGKIRFWDDRKIRPGEQWDAEIKTALATADIIFLLLSADLLNTDYVVETEMHEALRRHATGEAKVIPIKLSACLWQDTPLGHLQALPRKDGIISTAADKAGVWTEVVEEIKKVLAGNA